MRKRSLKERRKNSKYDSYELKEAENREPSKEDGIRIRFGREGRGDESHDRQYRVSTV